MATPIAIGIGAIAILWSAELLRKQVLIVQADHRLAAQDSSLIWEHTAPAVDGDSRFPPNEPAMAMLADSLRVARAAATLPDGPVRRARLDQVLHALGEVVAARPAWGEAWAIAAYATALRDGPSAVSTREAFARSYRDAPYLQRSASWRVGYGLDQWRMLDPATRDHLLNEAVWLSRTGPDEHDQVLALARQSAAYRYFMNRWIVTRNGDPDFDPIRDMAP